MLVVDDTPLVRDILGRVLCAAGHEVGTAVDGWDGLRRFREDPWDVVISDFQMPGMNGEEMTAAIKAEMPDMPVIMITGSRETAQNPGVYHAFLAKLVVEVQRQLLRGEAYAKDRSLSWWRRWGCARWRRMRCRWVRSEAVVIQRLGPQGDLMSLGPCHICMRLSPGMERREISPMDTVCFHKCRFS